MSPTEATIWPMIAHVALVFCLYLLLSSRRMGAVKDGRARPEQFRENREEPAESLIVKNAIANQFELPVLFYAVSILLYLVDADNPVTVAGGWLSSFLIRRGLSVNVARKATLFVFALLALPVLFAQGASNLWAAVLIIGLAAAAHQAFSANVLTLPSDLVPKAAVGSVIGIGGMAGAIGGMFFSKFVGYILDTTHNYSIIFMMAAGAYLLAFVVIHLLSPRLARNTSL